ncbi:MAG: hypothetical protein QXX74_02035, partial [Candidatus Micrarchaeaceae archaeon]
AFIEMNNMEDRSTKSEYLSSESFESRFCMVHLVSGFYAGQATIYPTSKQDILQREDKIYDSPARRFSPPLKRWLPCREEVNS